MTRQDFLFFYLYIYPPDSHNRKKSELIPKMTNVEPLKKLLKSQKLRWFEHVDKMSKEKAIAIKIMIKSKKETLKTMDGGC